MEAAQSSFSNALSRVRDPDRAIAEAERVYRSAMVPQFEQAMAEQMGKARAGLGRRYFSTYGQMTLDDAARKLGMARAQLERDIYDAAQAQYDRELGRAGGWGELLGHAQEARFRPIETLAGVISAGTPGASGYNAALSNTDQRRSRGSTLGTLATIAAGVAARALGF